MTNRRASYIAYMTSLAERSSPIKHNAPDRRRFFLEVDYNKLAGTHQPDNTGWNMVLMGYETRGRNNQHGDRSKAVTCIFDILKKAPSVNATSEELNAIFNEAKMIGEEILNLMEQEIMDPCSAPVPPPDTIDLNTETSFEVGPRFSNLYGYRFSIDVMQRVEKRPAPDPTMWEHIPDPE